MTSRDFCFWLQGFFEISGAEWTQTQPLCATKVDMIKKHLDLVFVHEIDPSMGDSKHQKDLNDIHGKDIFIRC